MCRISRIAVIVIAAALLGSVGTLASPGNLVRNSSFEGDYDGNTVPDKWTPLVDFTRSAEVVHYGQYAGKFFRADRRGTSARQRIAVSPETNYRFSGWINIPPSDETLRMAVSVTWLDSNGAFMPQSPYRRVVYITDDTGGGWVRFSDVRASLTGSAFAKIGISIYNASVPVYVDDFVAVALP